MKLGELCKKYEKNQHVYLDKNKPIIIRLDGKGFSKLTRKMQKPYCTVFQKSMQETLEYLLNNIQGTIVGYQQSDEITIVIDGYSKDDSQLYFNGRVDKILSISASMATWIFNKRMRANAELEYLNMSNTEERDEYLLWLIRYIESEKFNAIFDSRVFQCEKNEIYKMLKWRQMDCAKNSVSGYAQRKFSHKQLQGVNTKDRIQMLLDCGIDWNNESFINKYGYVMSLEKNDMGRQKFVNKDILFEEEKDIYEYIEKRVAFEK